MRVVPVPDEIKAQPWCLKTTVYAAPNGDLTDDEIPPAEAFHYYANMEPSGRQVPVTSVMLLLSDNDIQLIKEGAQHLMIGWPGVQVPVFMVPEVVNLDKL